MFSRSGRVQVRVRFSRGRQIQLGFTGSAHGLWSGQAQAGSVFEKLAAILGG